MTLKDAYGIVPVQYLTPTGSPSKQHSRRGYASIGCRYSALRRPALSNPNRAPGQPVRSAASVAGGCSSIHDAAISASSQGSMPDLPFSRVASRLQASDQSSGDCCRSGEVSFRRSPASHVDDPSRQ